MLSIEAQPYIDASVPVLREHGVTITRLFYKNMFEAHPELTNLFNMGNQANGSQQQSLAAAVFAYAAHYADSSALAPVVNRIVHKHVSIGLTAQHYPIVGKYLLGAIESTLGDAATPELMNAWREAYWLLADTLIEAEKNLYHELHTQPGELFPMRVMEVQSQSELVTSYKLQPADGKALPPFQPGQYLSVAVTFGDGSRQLRQYSLSDSPSQPWLKISVKRELEGRSTPAGHVSNWLHDNVGVGSTLLITAPCGDFTPDVQSNAPIVLLSAGIGITPMISVLNRIAELNPNRRVIFGHATRDISYHAPREDKIAALVKMPNLQITTFYENCEDVPDNVYGGFMNLKNLPDWEYSDTNVYLCGPTQFMSSHWQSLLDVGTPMTKLHREVFGPELLDHLL